jgi:NMD protein affecting ribosome stability and mRNA decay
MLLSCTNKGCYAQDNHLLDLTTNKVLCVDCGKEVVVSKPTLGILKSMGQVKRSVRSGIQSICKACKTQDNPVLKKLNGKVMIAACRKCGEKLDMHPSFIEAMKETGGYKDGDTLDDRNLVTEERPKIGKAAPKKDSKKEV